MSQSSPQITLADNVLIDQTAAGKLLSIPPATLQKWRSTGENNLPFIKIGRAVRYNTADLREWVAAHTHNKMGVNA